jgi:hypothetical protein
MASMNWGRILSVKAMVAKKPKKAKKLKAADIQTMYFNPLIREVDGHCLTCHAEELLQCSHFIEVGGSPALRFFPPNAWAQCPRCHHSIYHHDSPVPYTMALGVEMAEWLNEIRKRSIKYDQETLAEIKRLCIDEDIDGITEYIGRRLGAWPLPEFVRTHREERRND